MFTCLVVPSGKSDAPQGTANVLKKARSVALRASGRWIMQLLSCRVLMIYFWLVSEVYLIAPTHVGVSLRCSTLIGYASIIL